MKKLAVFSILVIILMAVALYIAGQSTDVASTAILIPTSGSVEVKEPAANGFVSIDIQVEVVEGTSIRTGSDGDATIVFADNSVLSLDANTEIRLDSIPGNESQNTSIFQLIGNTWHRVQSVAEGGNYQVETPSLVAAVRGTSFGVEVGEGEDASNQVTVLESEVDVAAKSNGQTSEYRRVAQDQFISFTRAQLREGIEARVQAITEEQRQRQWISRNIELQEKVSEEILREVYQNTKELRQKINQVREGRTEQMPKEIDSANEQELVALKELFKSSSSGEQYCAELEDFGVAKARQILDSARSNGQNISREASVLNFSINFCQDGDLTEQEAYDLETIQMGLTPALRDRFDLEVRQYLDQYFNVESTGQSDCVKLERTTEEEFIAGIVFIEESFGIEPAEHPDIAKKFLQEKERCSSTNSQN